MRALEVAGVTGLATVQDGGRPGHLHEGVPPGGALVAEALARANAAVDNPPGAAGIEVFGALRIRAVAPARLGLDDGAAVRMTELRPGDTIALTCAGARVAYLAVRGGFDVPLVLGGRGTLLASTFRIDLRSDRVGIRLDGPRLLRPPADLGASRPMVRGAIQLPPDGVPIVLGPDHPTTGGYPVLATVIRSDLGRLAALPIAASVRFAATPRH